jgi:hypothetical protein
VKLADVVQRVRVDSRKLTDYALNPESPWGRHKARVFQQALGYTRQNYAALLAQIEQQALEGQATFHSQDEFGQRYTVDLAVLGVEGQQAVVRTGWFVPRGEDQAHLVTLYVRR